MPYSCSCLQSYGIKVGYGGIPGPSGGRDGVSSQAGGCCGWNIWNLLVYVEDNLSTCVVFILLSPFSSIFLSEYCDLFSNPSEKKYENCAILLVVLCIWL